MKIAVVTRAGTQGNLAATFVAEQDDPYNSQQGKRWAEIDLDSEVSGPPIIVYTQVFKVGEVLLLDHAGRDTLTRKPSKWGIEIKFFDSVEEAYELAKTLV